MKPSTLEQAVIEANRFILAAKRVRISIVDGSGPISGKSWKAVEQPSRESAACLRASMDLSRALSDLRQNR